MHIIDLLSPSRISVDVALTSKKRLLEALAAALVATEEAPDERTIFKALCERERLGGTGLGHGVAVPHNRLPELDGARVAMIRAAEAVDFDALDDQPVDLAVGLLVPEACSQQHLNLLAQVAAIFSDATVRDRLRAAEDAPAVYQVLRDWQTEHPDELISPGPTTV